MNVMDAIRKRRSIRVYEEKPVEEEKLLAVLDAGRLAPSANNKQEWRYVVVRDPDLRRRLADATYDQGFVAGAPVVIACCAETDRRVMRCGQLAFTVDVAISIDHMTLAAVELGLGTCWVGSVSADMVREALGIPPEIEFVQLLTLGYPKGRGRPTTRLALDDIVHWERW